MKRGGFVNLISDNWILTFVVPFPFRTSSLCPCSREIWIEPFWRRVCWPIRCTHTHKSMRKSDDCLSVRPRCFVWVNERFKSISRQIRTWCYWICSGFGRCLCLVHFATHQNYNSPCVALLLRCIQIRLFWLQFCTKNKRCYCCVILSVLSVEASWICGRAVFVRNECVESCWRC